MYTINTNTSSSIEIVIGLLVNLVVGGGIIYGIIAYKRSSKAKARRKGEYPGQPWMWKKDWAEGRVKCMSGLGTLVIGIFALVWNLVSWGMIISARDQIFDPVERQALIALVFPAVGVILIIVWLVQVARHRRFGDSYFQMASVPGVVGGKLAGVVHISKHIQPVAGFKLTLNCYRRETRRRGKDNKTFERIIHQEEMIIAKEVLADDHTRTAVPILFAIPYEAQPTSETVTDTHNVSIHWTLAVTANLPGANYSGRFQVPVFRTEDSSREFELDQSAIESHVEPFDPDKMLKEQRVMHDVHEDKEIFFFPAFRCLYTASGLVFGAAWMTAMAVFMLKDNAPIFLALIMALVVVLFWCWAFDFLFWSCRVEMLQDGIRLRYGLFRLSRVEMPYDAVSDVAIKQGMQSGDTLYHSIVFTINGGKKPKICVGKRIRNRKVAQALVDMYKSSISDAGCNFSSGRNFISGVQLWSLWKERIFRWTLIIAMASYILSSKISPADIYWRMDVASIIEEFAADNPKMKKPLKTKKAGVLKIVRDKGITDITALSSLPIHYLDIGSTRVVDLSPLEGMKLKTLKAWNMPLSDISVVEGMPLEHLTIGHCPVSDISMLEGMDLKFLSITRTKIRDISVLKGMPLTTLDMNDARVTDIAALKGAPLRVLKMNGLKINDISALKGMPLKQLWIAGTHVWDISALSGMPLKELWLQKTRVRDVSCLASCSKLEKVLLNRGCIGVEKLKDLPNLERIGYDYKKDMPATEFWVEHEKQRKGDREDKHNKRVLSKDNLLQNPGNDLQFKPGEIPGWEMVESTAWGWRSGNPSPKDGEVYFYSGAVGSAELRQDVDVTRYRSDIMEGRQKFIFDGYVSSWKAAKDTSRIIIEFMDQSKTKVLDSYDSGERKSSMKWEKVHHEQIAPTNTSYIRVRLITKRYDGKNNDGYFDALSLQAVSR